MVQFECPRHSNPSVSSILGDGKFSQLPKLALWGNKNGLPSMKGKKLENVQDKMGLKGCNWSSLNTPGTQSPLSHPIETFVFKLCCGWQLIMSLNVLVGLGSGVRFWLKYILNLWSAISWKLQSFDNFIRRKYYWRDSMCLIKDIN